MVGTARVEAPLELWASMGVPSVGRLEPTDRGHTILGPMPTLSEWQLTGRDAELVNALAVIAATRLTPSV